MPLPEKKSISLLELLIALVLVSLLVLGIGSINTFSNYQVRNTNRRLELQNDLAYILQHMARRLSSAIGSRNQPAMDTSDIGNDPAITVWIDGNENSKRDSYPTDWQTAYVFKNKLSGQGDRYKLRYYPIYVNPSSQHEVLSERIYSFTPAPAPAPADFDCADIEIIACWDPADINASDLPNGTPDNPCVKMQNTIHLLGVSAR